MSKTLAACTAINVSSLMNDQKFTCEREYSRLISTELSAVSLYT
jgi:hypothetical protein